jgi:ElaB/YqjD/DUF883 family membrane-anchored ribosome-binding protein
MATEGTYDENTESVGNEPVPHLVDTNQTDAAAGKVAKLKEDLKGQADRAMGKAREVAGSAYDKAAAKARVARERAQELTEQGTAKVRATVQEQPLAALGAGIALGFVVGWLISGRNKD